MSSHYALYIKEREGKETLENDQGFASYIDLNNTETIYISDMYIRPEYRGKGYARHFYNEIAELAKGKHYKTILANVDISTEGWKFSEMIMKKDGFQEIGKDDNLKFFIKELNYGQ
jgi:GNAT superfamily N-acetyltransferase